MLVLTLKFVLAHIIGDFLLQPSKWIKSKQKKKHKSPYLYLHIVVHFVILFTLLRFDVSYLLGITVVVLMHLIIDVVKLNLRKSLSHSLLFFAD